MRPAGRTLAHVFLKVISSFFTFMLHQKSFDNKNLINFNNLLNDRSTTTLSLATSQSFHLIWSAATRRSLWPHMINVEEQLYSQTHQVRITEKIYVCGENFTNILQAAFFVRKCFAQLFCAYNLFLFSFFVKKETGKILGEIDNRCQFHQCFTCPFFVRKSLSSFFSTYILALNFWRQFFVRKLRT